jgi:hypothetical protein
MIPKSARTRLRDGVWMLFFLAWPAPESVLAHASSA